MQVSMTRLLQGLIDYAGLFVPAELKMEDAAKRFAAALRGPEAWLVSRFICPAGKLPDLAVYLESTENFPYFPVSVVGAAGQNQAEWESALESAVVAMNAFDRRMGDRAAIEGFEIRIPDCKDVARYVRDLSGFSEADVFVEVPWDPEMPDALATLAGTDWLCAKARTGGTTPKSVPSAYELASFIRNCVDLELPFKLTAGLHHAFPQWDDSVGATTHGFLNVATAVVFALTDDLSAREIENLLTETEARTWSFEPDGFEWRGRRASSAEMEESRDLFVSFGSCSIDEPFDELTRLG